MTLSQNAGTVFLVGAGPGDAGLITLKGVECLAQADLILYDYLVNPRILEHARRECEKICLGRHGGGASNPSRIMPQQEINDRMVQAALQGKTVVRLKGGDPAVFARVGEEVAALLDAGVPYQIVPGITAALAAGSYAGVSITHRHLASAVAIVTGREDSEKSQPDLDYRSLARFPGTLVFYMGVTTAPHWTAELIAGGKPAETPAVIVRRCSWPDQETIPSTLGSIAQTLAERRLRPPVLIIVGEVASLEPVESWFTARPMFGQRVVVTRPLEQAAGLSRRLESLGAEVLIQPAIEISPPDDWSRADAALASLERFDWIVFSSANGVRYFLDRLLATGADLRALGRNRLAAIGPGTEQELARYRLKADLIPEEYRAESLAASLIVSAPQANYLLIRASRGREVLAESLRAAGASVEQIVVYRSTDIQTASADIAQRMAAGQIDWVTVSSSAIARSLDRLFGKNLQRTKLASISPITSASLRELGHEPAVEARTYTLEGLIEAMLRQPGAL